MSTAPALSVTVAAPTVADVVVSVPASGALVPAVSVPAAGGVALSLAEGGAAVAVSAQAGPVVSVSAAPAVAPVALAVASGAVGVQVEIGGPSPVVVADPAPVYTAAGDLSGHRAVRLTAQGVSYPDLAQPGHAGTVIGLTTGAALAGRSVAVQRAGLLIEPSWSWAPDAPVYVGPSGGLTQSPARTPGQRWQQIFGRAISPASIYIDPMPPILVTDV